MTGTKDIKIEEKINFVINQQVKENNEINLMVKEEA